MLPDISHIHQYISLFLLWDPLQVQLVTTQITVTRAVVQCTQIRLDMTATWMSA